MDSSNYLPTPAWACGNQLVALNFQHADLSMQLNDTKFRENGGCGYVLKPPYMLSRKNAARGSMHLKLHLMSGSRLPTRNTTSVFYLL